MGHKKRNNGFVLIMLLAALAGADPEEFAENELQIMQAQRSQNGGGDYRQQHIYKDHDDEWRW